MKSLSKDRETWWSQGTEELEDADASVNFKSFPSPRPMAVRGLVSVRQCVKLMVRQSPTSKIIFDDWLFFEGQSNWSVALATLTGLICSPCSLTTDPPNKEEVCKEL